jgi:hypothetical protein
LFFGHPRTVLGVGRNGVIYFCQAPCPGPGDVRGTINILCGGKRPRNVASSQILLM